MLSCKKAQTPNPKHPCYPCNCRRRLPRNMTPTLDAASNGNQFQDLSGIEIKAGDNPYDALIEACHGHPVEIQSLYSAHRTARNTQQRDKFLSSEFRELIIDPFLLRLENPEIEPGFRDPRNCLVFWARPPEHILILADRLQTLLMRAAPSRYFVSQLSVGVHGHGSHTHSTDLWLMPLHRMHMTTLEVTHSRTAEHIASLVSALRPVIPLVTSLPYTRRARLVRPMLSYDLSAIALSFVPAAGEKVLSPPPVPPLPANIVHPGTGDGSTTENDGYTYHHLRRDVFELAQSTGVGIESRYVVPSAHITIGRYLGHKDHETPEQRAHWIKAIEDANSWLEKEVWDVADGEFTGEWIVGQEKGLDAHCGTLWYGGGRTIMMGEGF
ncbi:RNA ligase/cyclic nucleotide phosphodiesterase [Podospora didyma]|uniref:RNA ligase/cyclic nucleotide phosphodiesterase n=1 Tax=Podospora didyma TaxID=330526 RepID=A0AAE0U8X6_9PEZI|nr:RNA ligase/cyclic nucleotide phosphodiesterase [Podospora didyma]